MDLQTGIEYLIYFANNSVYPAQGALALYGAFQVILVLQRLRAKQFSSGKAADKFMEDVHEELQKGNLEGVAAVCDTPAHWSKAVPQLILVALANQDRDLPSIKRLLGESFDREVLSDLQYRLSWINTVIKSEPMLGLLGTVHGMVSAFSVIANSTVSPKPADLAKGITMALVTTLEGLIVAIPAVIAFALFKNMQARSVLEASMAAENLLAKFPLQGKRPAAPAPSAAGATPGAGAPPSA